MNYDSVLTAFALAAATDALDGWTARWLRVESKLGEVLDPLADKVLLTGVFFALAMVRAVPWWITLVVLGRDGAILAGAGALWAWGRRADFPPSLSGKISTIFQMGYVLIVVVRNGNDLSLASYLVALLAVISLGDYARRIFGRR